MCILKDGAVTVKVVQVCTLFAANGSPIATFGELTLELDLGLRRSFHWRFTVADVTRPILGADFLSFLWFARRCQKPPVVGFGYQPFNKREGDQYRWLYKVCGTLESESAGSFTAVCRNYKDVT